MTELHEVYVEANEPWHDGLRAAYRDAVLEFVECSDPEVTRIYERQGFGFDDADAQIGNYCYSDDSYVGFGQNAYPDADGFVFADARTADRLAGILREHTRVAGARVVQCRLEA